MRNVYLIAACRTAIGSFGGSSKDICAAKLGETIIVKRDVLCRQR